MDQELNDIQLTLDELKTEVTGIPESLTLIADSLIEINDSLAKLLYAVTPRIGRVSSVPPPDAEEEDSTPGNDDFKYIVEEDS